MRNKQRILCDIFFWKTVICHLWKLDEAFQNLITCFKEVKKAIWSSLAFWIYKICRYLSRFRLMRWWWWIVFVVWLTDERLLTLFPAGVIVRDPHHRESPTRREQGLNLRRICTDFYWQEHLNLMIQNKFLKIFKRWQKNFKLSILSRALRRI